MIRSFIAIELDEKTHEYLTQVQEELKKQGGDIKWVTSSNIHLTLKFLGNVTPEKIDKIKVVLDEIAKTHAPFEMSLSEVGGFPNLKRPRVIWTGIDKGAQQATALAGDLEEKLEELGFLKESRPFKCHLTLGRVRKNKDPGGPIKRPPGSSFSPVFPVTHLTLFQSTLTPKGAVYTPLHKAKLQD